MSFEIIKLKQEMADIAGDITPGVIEQQVFETFEDLLKSEDFLSEQQRQEITNLQNALVAEIEMNTGLIKTIANQPAQVATNSSALQFVALNALKIAGDSDPQFNEILDPVVRKISHLVKKLEFFEQSRLSLITETREIDKNNQALLYQLKHIKELPTTNIMSDKAKEIIASLQVGYLNQDDVVLAELKEIINQFEADDRPFAERLILFKDFFDKRWQKIRGTPDDYTKSPDNPINKICLQLTTAIAETSPDLGRFHLLMPSVKPNLSDITYTYFDDPDLKLEHIILNDDQSVFIEIQACLAAAEDQEVYKHTTMIDGRITALSATEKDAVINHSKLSRIYADAVTNLRKFTGVDDQSFMAKSMGAHLQRLAEQLNAGGVYHINSSAPKTGDARRATHTNAGEAANLGIVEFSRYIEVLPESEKQKLFNLKASGTTENLGQLWQRLATPTAVNLADTRYCVELLAPQIFLILRENPTLYNKGALTLDLFQQGLEIAKTEFNSAVSSDSYKPYPPSRIQTVRNYKPAEQNSLNIALAQALSAKETDLALSLLDIGADANFRTNLIIDGTSVEKASLLSAAITQKMHSVVDRILSMNHPITDLYPSLFYAARTNQIEMVNKILDHPSNIGVNLRLSHTGETLIMHAVKIGNAEMLETFLKHGGAINVTDMNGYTELDYILGKYNLPCPDRLGCLLAYTDHTPQDISYSLITIINRSLIDNQWSADDIITFIQRYKTDIRLRLHSSLVNPLLKSLQDAQQIDVAEQLIGATNNKYNLSLRDFVTNSKVWNDANSARLLVATVNSFNSSHQSEKDYWFVDALKINKPLLAGKIFDMGVNPNKALLFTKVLSSGYEDLALHIIDSGKLSVKTIQAALKVNSSDRVKAQLYEAMATLYESGINKITDELQSLVNANQPQPGFSLFTPPNPALVNKAVNKLISQLKTQEFVEFSAAEVAALKTAKVAKIMNTYKKDNNFPQIFIKIHTLKDLDKIVQARRGKGDNSTDKVFNTIAAIETDLRIQQDRLAQRLFKAISATAKENITAKLDAIMVVQEKIAAFRQDGKDLNGLINDIAAARDESRGAKPVSQVRHAVKTTKNFFKANSGDSDTAMILNNAGKDLAKLKANFISENRSKPIASVTSQDSVTTRRRSSS